MIDHHAKLCRTLRRVGVGLALLGGLPLSHAAYTQLTPPPGWVAGTGAAATYQPAAASAWVNSKAIADAAIASASGTSKIRVSFAVDRAAASRVLAGRVGTALLSGAGGPLGVGLSVGAALVMPEMVEWFSGSGFQWNPSKEQFEKENQTSRVTYCFSHFSENQCGITSPLQHYEQWIKRNLSDAQISPSPTFIIKEQSKSAVVVAYTVQFPGYPRSEANNNYSPKSYLTQADHGVEWVPADYETEVKPAVQPLPIPEKPPNVVWPASWPVKDPVINPDSTGKPQPLFIPTGNPVKNPKYDPSQPTSATNQPYLQPGIRVVPAPAPGKPWQVDVQPVDKPVDSAEPKPEPKPDPEPSDGDQPREDDRDLCERNPDILACAKPELDTPDGEIPKKTVDVSYQPENLFGGGACPADKTMTAHGVQLKVWDWQQGCGYITSYVRPVILVLCACVAMAIIAGGAKA